MADKGIKDSGLDFLFGPNPPSLLGSGPGETRRSFEIFFLPTKHYFCAFLDGASAC